MHPVHVALCSDSAYLQPMAVAVRSVVESAREARRLHFWILTKDGGSAALTPVTSIITQAGAECTLLSASQIGPWLAGAPTRGHISVAAYYRLFLPELLPEHVTRIVYLDSDVVVRRPIEDLWAVDLDGHPLAAVMKPRAMEYRDVGLRAETDYFNSGVLVMDPAQWRARRVCESALDYALSHRSCRHGHDQPALNHVFAGRWQRLDPRWNQQFKFFVHTAGYLRMNRAELRRLRREPYIIHYTTSSKPWDALNTHPWRHCYFEVLDRTPFAGWRPPAAPWSKRLGRALALPVPHWLYPAVLRNVYRPRFHHLKERLHHAVHGHPWEAHSRG